MMGRRDANATGCRLTRIANGRLSDRTTHLHTHQTSSPGEKRSPFTDALFALIDADGSGTIDFDEYVRVLLGYCMYTKEDILRCESRGC